MAPAHKSRRQQRSRAAGENLPKKAILWSRIPSLLEIWTMLTLYLRDHYAIRLDGLGVPSLKDYYMDAHILTFEQHNFVEEYGPATRDFILELPIVRHLCQLLGWLCRSEHDANARSPMMELPDELLLMIVQLLLPRCEHRGCARDAFRREALVSLSRANKRLRHILAPHLYRDIAVVHGWSRSKRALAMIASSPDINRHTEIFKFDMDIARGTRFMPAMAVEPKLCALLPKFTRLHTLHLEIPADYSQRFRVEFRKANPCLSSVKTLVLGPHLEFVIAHCPNVDSISSLAFLDQWRYDRRVLWMPRYFGPGGPSDQQANTTALIHAAEYTETVRQFELHEGWEASLLQAVHHALPNLQSLSMLGYLSPPDTPAEVLPALKRFRFLRQLVLPWLEGLNIDFHQPGMCGNPFLGPGGDERLRQVRLEREQQAIDAARPIAQIVFRELPNLERLWIGSGFLFTPTLKRNGAMSRMQFRQEVRPKPATLAY